MIRNWMGLFLLTIITVIPFSPERNMQGMWITLVDVLMVVAIMLWLRRIILDRNAMKPNLPMFIWVLGFILLSCISATNAINQMVVVKETIKYMTIFGFFYVCVNCINEQIFLRSLPQAITVTATIVSLWFLVDFALTKESIAHVSTHGRIWFRQILNPMHLNTLGAFLVITFPFSLGGIFHASSTRNKALFGFMALTQILALSLTYSRGNWIAFIVSMALYFLWEHHMKGIGYVIVFVMLSFIVISMFVPNLYIKERLISSVSSQDESIMIRVMYAKTAISMIEKMPLTGTGSGNYKIAVKQRLNLDVDNMTHNMFLQAAAEMGIIAVIILAGIIIKYYYDSCVIYYSIINDPFMKSLVLCSVVSFTALIVSSQFGDAFVRNIKEYFALCLAVPYAVRNSIIREG